MDALLEDAPGDRANEWRAIMARFRRSRGGVVVEEVPSDSWDSWGVGTDMLASEEGILTRIYATPPGRPFLFSEDDEGTQYYVGSWIVNVSPAQFSDLAVGMYLRVWPEEEGDDGGGMAVSVSRADVVVDVPEYVWIDSGNSQSEDDDGGIVAEIYATPRGRPFLFARDDEGTAYYVHCSRTNVNQVQFGGLRNGTQLRVWPSSNRDDLHHSAKTVMRAEVMEE